MVETTPTFEGRHIYSTIRLTIIKSIEVSHYTVQKVGIVIGGKMALFQLMFALNDEVVKVVILLINLKRRR